MSPFVLWFSLGLAAVVPVPDDGSEIVPLCCCPQVVDLTIDDANLPMRVEAEVLPPSGLKLTFHQAAMELTAKVRLDGCEGGSCVRVGWAQKLVSWNFSAHADACGNCGGGDVCVETFGEDACAWDWASEVGGAAGEECPWYLENPKELCPGGEVEVTLWDQPSFGPIVIDTTCHLPTGAIVNATFRQYLLMECGGRFFKLRERTVEREFEWVYNVLIDCSNFTEFADQVGDNFYEFNTSRSGPMMSFDCMPIDIDCSGPSAVELTRNETLGCE